MWGASPLSDSRKGVSTRQCVPAGAEGCQATVTGGTGRSARCTMFGGKTTAQTAPGTRLHTNTPQFCEGGRFTLRHSGRVTLGSGAQRPVSVFAGMARWSLQQV